MRRTLAYLLRKTALLIILPSWISIRHSLCIDTVYCAVITNYVSDTHMSYLKNITFHLCLMNFGKCTSHSYERLGMDYHKNIAKCNMSTITKSMEDISRRLPYVTQYVFWRSEIDYNHLITHC